MVQPTIWHLYDHYYNPVWPHCMPLISGHKEQYLFTRFPCGFYISSKKSNCVIFPLQFKPLQKSSDRRKRRKQPSSIYVFIWVVNSSPSQQFWSYTSFFFTAFKLKHMYNSTSLFGGRRGLDKFNYLVY